jgi:hypothetical protein
MGPVCNGSPNRYDAAPAGGADNRAGRLTGKDTAGLTSPPIFQNIRCAPF